MLYKIQSLWKSSQAVSHLDARGRHCELEIEVLSRLDFEDLEVHYRIFREDRSSFTFSLRPFNIFLKQAGLDSLLKEAQADKIEKLVQLGLKYVLKELDSGIERDYLIKVGLDGRAFARYVEHDFPKHSKGQQLMPPPAPAEKLKAQAPPCWQLNPDCFMRGKERVGALCPAYAQEKSCYQINWQNEIKKLPIGGRDFWQTFLGKRCPGCPVYQAFPEEVKKSTRIE